MKKQGYQCGSECERVLFFYWMGQIPKKWNLDQIYEWAKPYFNVDTGMSEREHRSYVGRKFQWTQPNWIHSRNGEGSSVTPSIPRLEEWIEGAQERSWREDPSYIEWVRAFKKHQHQFHILRDSIEIQMESGVKFIYPSHEDYPKNFFLLEDPPWLLSYWGHPVWRYKWGLSVVGSREPSSLSVQWMEFHLTQFLLKEDFYIASGGARGVDQCAHRICLRNKKPTLVFLPSGLNVMYPEVLYSWKASIIENGGAFISEFPWGKTIRKNHFHSRNRLIAAISLSTLIVEARLQSGTLITARNAIQMGKPLLILPSHPLDIGARGGLNLLSDGATPIRDFQDLIPILRAERSLQSIYENFEQKTQLGDH